MTMLKRVFVSVILPLLTGVAVVAAAPLKVFILAGQSNMEGYGAVATFPHIGMDSQLAPMLDEMVDRDGNPLVLEEVHITYMSGSGGTRNGKGSDYEPREKRGPLTAGFAANHRGPGIGPEYNFGIFMHKHLKEPFLIIKTAWGGRSLNRDFRPPSTIPADLKGKDPATIEDDNLRYDRIETGRFYHLMMDHVKAVLADPGAFHPAYNERDGVEVAGFVWFQGFNDMVDSKAYPGRNKEGGFDLYTELLAAFIRDVRSDLNVPDLPFVVGVIGMDGAATPETEAEKSPRSRGIVPNFRKAQAAVGDLREFQGTVSVVHTDQFWDYELDAIDKKFREINREIARAKKKDELTRSELNELREKLTEERLTEEEIKIHRAGRAAQSYHYLGSAKIYGRIGLAFAGALAQLMN